MARIAGLTPAPHFLQQGQCHQNLLFVPPLEKRNQSGQWPLSNRPGIDTNTAIQPVFKV